MKVINLPVFGRTTIALRRMRNMDVIQYLGRKVDPNKSINMGAHMYAMVGDPPCQVDVSQRISIFLKANNNTKFSLNH